MRMRLLFVGAVLVLALVSGCGGDASDTPVGSTGAEREEGVASLPEVDVARVTLATLEARLAASGSIRARRTSEIAAEVPGRLVAIAVDVGDDVEEGAELFQIDPIPYETALAEARAGLALARAEAQNAQREEQRVVKLIEERAVSEQRLDELQTGAAVARARVEQAEAHVEGAERDLARTRVLAPYAGSIVERLAHEGVLAQQQTVVVLQETGALEVVLDVPDAAPVAVRVGDPMEVFLEGRGDPLAATVARVSDRVDAETRTYEVRADVVDETGLVRAGSYVRAEIRPRTLQARPVVPVDALVTRDGRSYLMRVEDSVTALVPVTLGVKTRESVEVLRGISEGNLVVRGEATRRLGDGSRVAVRPPEDAATRVTGTKTGREAGS